MNGLTRRQALVGFVGRSVLLMSVRPLLLLLLLPTLLFGNEANKSLTIIKIISITATKSKPSQFKVESSDPTVNVLTSSSDLIQASLLPGMFYLQGDIDVEIDPASKEIQRVMAHPEGGAWLGHHTGKYNILRIATQGTPGSPDEHLEVFLQGELHSYNIYDSRIQQLLIAVFSQQSAASGIIGIDAVIDAANDEITSVTLR